MLSQLVYIHPQVAEKLLEKKWVRCKRILAEIAEQQSGALRAERGVPRMALKWGFAEVCSGIGVVILLAFCAGGIVAGMLQLVDLAEERTAKAKRVVVYSGASVSCLHMLLLLLDSLPLTPVLLGLVAHIGYTSLAASTKFPSIQITEPLTIACAILFASSVYTYANMVAVELIDMPTSFGIGFLMSMCLFVPFGVVIVSMTSDTMLPGGFSSSNKGGVRVNPPR